MDSWEHFGFIWIKKVENNIFFQDKKHLEQTIKKCFLEEKCEKSKIFDLFGNSKIEFSILIGNLKFSVEKKLFEIFF